jgi:hypothetical protein
MSKCNNCSHPITGEELFCPSCGTKVGNSTARTKTTGQSSEQPSPKIYQRAMWATAIQYLEENPEGDYACDAVIFAEYAKYSMALSHVMTTGKIDFSLYENNFEVYSSTIMKILNWDEKTIPKTIEIPNRIPKFYIHPDLKTQEFEDFISKKVLGYKVDAKLEENHKRFWAKIVVEAENNIHEVLEGAKKKYSATLVNGKTKKEIDGVSEDNLLDRANEHYREYAENNFRDASNGFKELAALDPFRVYNHYILSSIYTELKEYEQAIEEILYASYLDEWHCKEKRRTGKGHPKRDINVLLSLAINIHRLGLSPALVNIVGLKNLGKEYAEELESSDRDFNRLYNELYFWIKLGHLTAYLVANNFLLANITKSG